MKILQYLEEKQKEDNVEFVYGIGKRKSELQRLMEKFLEFKERQEKYNIHNECSREGIVIPKLILMQHSCI